MFFRPLFVFLTILAASAAYAQHTPSVISDVRLSGDSQHTQITLILSQRVPVSAFALADPARIVVDLPEVDFRLDEDSGRQGKGLVSAFRYGQFAANQSRLVFDIKEPALVGDVQIISTVEGAPHRVTIDLTRTTRENFLAQIARREAELGGSSQNPSPRLADAASDKANAGDLPLVVLDPGHGGIDSGAHAATGGFMEKSFTLSFAKSLKHALEETGAVRVAMTRESDTFIALQQRTRFAREKKAALFLSIHADSYAQPRRDLSGATVYTLSEKASDREAAAYAERENRADEIAGIEHKPDSNEVADILFDLMQRETKSFSGVFSQLLANELKGAVTLNHNPRRSAGFVVLRAPDVPAALLELGYLSNGKDAKLMQSEQWQNETAKAVTRAVLAYLRQSRVTGEK